MTTLAAPNDWKDLLAKRTARPGANVLRLHPSQDKAAALVDSPVGPTTIDEARRSATFVISTPTPDRSDDVVSPRGARLENYARNPVVYYDHGFSGIQVPIGKCEDESRQLAVRVTDEGIEATCYFADSVEGRQIFELVKQSVLRAASVNLVPIAYTIRTPDGLVDRPGLEIAEWELLEWSVVGIPDNPQAIRKILAGGVLAGAAICEPIRHSLLTACPKREAEPLERGFRSVPATRLHLPEEGETDEQDATPETPLGARAFEKFRRMLEAVCEELKIEAAGLGYPDVKAFCNEMQESLTGHLEEIRTCYGSHDAPLGDEAFDSRGQEPAIDGQSALRLLACCSELRALRQMKAIAPELAARLHSVERRIGDVYRQAHKRKPASPVPVSADMAVVLELLKEFRGLVGELQESVPRATAP